MDLRTDYLTILQASRKYGWARSSVNRWCREGWLPAVRVGERWLIRAADAAKCSPPPRGPNPGKKRTRKTQTA